MKKHFLYLSLLGFFSGYGQVNFLGKPGYIATPSAEWNTQKDLSLSFGYLPTEYSIFNLPENDRNTVHFYNARVNFTSFMEVGLSIAHRPHMADKIGVGDRQLDLRFLLLKEQKYFPAVVLGWTPPASVSP
ncbi:YjbH domain-containing protein, partial [Longispora fulva]|uniref:YjbH domain-containing protein n=2 Tax=Bacteria TaxID=2 RepID=UPI0036425C3C